jgi:hypothetical protein
MATNAAASKSNQPAKEPVTASAKPAEAVSRQQTTSEQSQEATADLHPPLFEDYLAELAPAPQCPKCQELKLIVRVYDRHVQWNVSLGAPPSSWPWHCNACSFDWYDDPTVYDQIRNAAAAEGKFPSTGLDDDFDGRFPDDAKPSWRERQGETVDTLYRQLKQVRRLYRETGKSDTQIREQTDQEFKVLWEWVERVPALDRAAFLTVSEWEDGDTFIFLKIATLYSHARHLGKNPSYATIRDWRKAYKSWLKR